VTARSRRAQRAGQLVSTLGAMQNLRPMRPPATVGDRGPLALRGHRRRARRSTCFPRTRRPVKPTTLATLNALPERLRPAASLLPASRFIRRRESSRRYRLLHGVIADGVSSIFLVTYLLHPCAGRLLVLGPFPRDGVCLAADLLRDPDPATVVPRGGDRAARALHAPIAASPGRIRRAPAHSRASRCRYGSTCRRAVCRRRLLDALTTSRARLRWPDSWAPVCRGGRPAADGIRCSPAAPGTGETRYMSGTFERANGIPCRGAIAIRRCADRAPCESVREVAPKCFLFVLRHGAGAASACGLGIPNPRAFYLRPRDRLPIPGL
jgi:hypothetical protein